MATTEAAVGSAIGAAIKRVEDPRLMTGSARYLAGTGSARGRADDPDDLSDYGPGWRE